MHTLELKIMQLGVAGASGTRYAIAPDGAWTISQVGPASKIDMGDGLPVTQTGTLTKEQLQNLAAELTRNDLTGLNDVGGDINPRVVSFKFGETAAKLELPAMSSLPTPDVKTIKGRYGGLVKVVRLLLTK